MLRLVLSFGIACLFLLALFVAFEAGGYYPEHLFPRTVELHYQGDSKALEMNGMLKGVHKIVIVGDSVTALGSRPRGFLTLLRDYLGAIYPSQDVQIVNAGMHGDRSADMLSRFNSALKEKPELIILIAGINDILRKEDAASFQQNMQKMVEEGKAANAKIILCSLPLSEEAPEELSEDQIRKFDEMIKALSEAQNIEFADLGSALSQLSSSYQKQVGFRDRLVTIDGIHLSAAGNRVLAQCLLEAMGVAKDVREKVVTTGGSAEF